MWTAVKRHPTVLCLASKKVQNAIRASFTGTAASQGLRTNFLSSHHRVCLSCLPADMRPFFELKVYRVLGFKSFKVILSKEKKKF